jgi:hypothetical protein
MYTCENQQNDSEDNTLIWGKTFARLAATKKNKTNTEVIDSLDWMLFKWIPLGFFF